MKHITYTMMLMGALLTATSCSEEAFDAPQTEHAVQGRKVTITVGLPESDSNSRVAYDDTTLKLSWQEGDQLIVCGYKATTDGSGTATTAATQQTFTLNTGAGTTQATFTGTLDETADYYKVFYQTKNLTIDAQGKPTFSYTNQVQTSAASTAHLKDNLYLSSDPATGEKQLTKEDITTNNFVLTAHSSIFCFNIDSYKTEIGNLHTLIWTSNKNATPASVSLKLEGDAAKAKSLKAYIAFDPATMKLTAGQPITLAFIGDNAIYLAEAKSNSGKDYQPGYRYNAKVSTTSSTDALSTWTAVVPDDTKAEILITTTDGKLPTKMPTFDTTKSIPGTNSWLLSFDDPNREFTDSEDFGRNDNLLAVHFSNQFTSIPTQCFECCSSLVSVKLPSGLESIGYEAFKETALTTMDLPITVTTLGSSAFQSCKNLTTVTGKEITSIEGSLVFQGCTALETVNLPKATTIGIQVFQWCTALKTVNLPKATTIKYQAFQGCTALETVKLPEATTIEDYVFNECGLTTITLPKVQTIGTGAFRDCKELKELNITSTNLTTLPKGLCFDCSKLKTVTGCDGVITINDEAFGNCTALQTIDLDKIQTIGEAVFNDSGLESISLPAIKSISDNAFAYYTNLKTLHIGSKLTTLPVNLCQECSNLTKVTGCEGVTTIGGYAFFKCTALTDFAPFNTDKVTTVDDKAFDGCTALKTPLPLTITNLGQEVIASSGITEFTIYNELGLSGLDTYNPLETTKQLTKLTIKTADEAKADEFIPDESNRFQQSTQIELFLLNDWNTKTDAKYKPDFAARKWKNHVWKSITLINADGANVTPDGSGNTTLPDVDDGGSPL